MSEVINYEFLEKQEFVPFYDKIIVELINSPSEKEHSSGLIITKMGEEKRFAKVIATGTGRMMANGTFFRLAIQPGDYVELEPQNFYAEREFGDKTYHICHESDIRCLLCVDGTYDEYRARVDKHNEKLYTKIPQS